MQRLAELRQEQNQITASIEQILAKPRAEKRALNTEETAAYDTAFARVSAVLKTIEAEEASEQRAADAAKAEEVRLEAERRAKPGVKSGVGGDGADAETRAFEAWVRGGTAGVPEELRDELRKSEQRALASGTDAAGGHAVPVGFEATLIKSLLAFGGVVNAIEASGGTVQRTSGGNPIEWPTLNDTSSGAQLGENTDATTDSALDTAFGSVTIGAYTFTSNLVKVSNLLLADAGVNIQEMLTGHLQERIGRIWNTRLTTGNGSTQPQGIVTASTLGKTAAGAAAITAAELLDLIHSVNSAYRNKARFMFNDLTLKLLLKLTDGQSLPIFQPSYRESAPATIHGYPFTINDDMPAATTGLKSVLFGDFSYHKVRVAGGVVVKRLVERFAEANQTAFVGFARMDAKYIDASGGAVKHLIQA